MWQIRWMRAGKVGLCKRVTAATYPSANDGALSVIQRRSSRRCLVQWGESLGSSTGEINFAGPCRTVLRRTFHILTNGPLFGHLIEGQAEQRMIGNSPLKPFVVHELLELLGGIPHGRGHYTLERAIVFDLRILAARALPRVPKGAVFRNFGRNRFCDHPVHPVLIRPMYAAEQVVESGSCSWHVQNIEKHSLELSIWGNSDKERSDNGGHPDDATPSYREQASYTRRQPTATRSSQSAEPHGRRGSLQGVSTIKAMAVLAEFGKLTRFDSPRELMGFLGLVPGEYSSSSRRRQGAITKTGNGHICRLLIESAWACRFPVRKTAHQRRKGAKASGPGPSDRLGGPETPLRPVSASPTTGCRRTRWSWRSRVSSSPAYRPSRVKWDASLTAPG